MSDEPPEEVPQRALPKISIAWMLGMITVSAGLFTIFKLAWSGSPWAQGFTLIIAIALATLMSYAALFLVGMLIDAALNSIRSSERPTRHRHPNDSKGHSAKSTTLLVLLALGSLFSGTVNAQPLWQGTVPSNVPRLGYTVTVSLYPHPGAGGYRSVLLKFTPTGGAFLRDHLVTVTASSYHRFKTRAAAATTTRVEINESDTAFTQELLIPLLGNSSMLRIFVSENGKLIGKQPFSLNFNTQLDRRHAGQSVTMGIIDPSAFNATRRFPDLRAVSAVFGQTALKTSPLPEYVNSSDLSNKEAREFAENLQPSWIQYRIFDPNSMTNTWLALSDLDVMMVDAPSLSKLRSDNERSTRAIFDWVAAGGRLWIYGETASTVLESNEWVPSELTSSFVRKNVPNETKIRNQLRLGERNDTSILVDEYWQGGVVKQSQNRSGQGFTLRSRVYDKFVKASHPIVEIKSPDEVTQPLRRADYGLGEIITIDQDDPFPGSLQLWSTIRNESRGMNRDDLWIDRNGLDLQSGNTNYWRWLIDSVGGPPVVSFLTLNSAFVLLVGPIAYFLLRRAGRLYLLYFCGPALAVLVTTGLFAFAVFSDGIDTRLRTHQWTWLDQPARAALTQDRVTYYSSFGADELSFPNDAMVTPVLPLGIDDHSRQVGESVAPNGQVVWSGEQQIWKGDFLPTRSQVQYQVTRPIRLADPAIRFEPMVSNEPSDETDARYECHNDMPRQIGPIFFRAPDGSLFQAQSVAAGESARMKPAKQVDFQNLISDRVLPPVGFVPNVQSSWATVYGRRSPQDHIPLLERRLIGWQNRLPPRHFAGLAELDPTRFATEAPRVSDSHHIVMGRTE